MSDSRPVLLLMDFQHGIVERIADAAVVEAADRAAKAARAAGIPVMFVRVGFRPGYPEAAATTASSPIRSTMPAWKSISSRTGRKSDDNDMGKRLR